MVVGNGCGKDSPGTVVVADLSQASGLGATAVDVEVSVTDIRADTKTFDGITVGVDSFNIDGIIGADAV